MGFDRRSHAAVVKQVLEKTRRRQRVKAPNKRDFGKRCYSTPFWIKAAEAKRRLLWSFFASDGVSIKQPSILSLEGGD